MNVTGKLLGIMAVAVGCLLFYLSIFVVGINFAPSFMIVMAYVGLALTVLMFVFVLSVTTAKTED